MSDQKVVVVIGGGVSGNSSTTFLAKTKGIKVIAIYAHEFLEWTLGATYFLTHPSEYDNFVSRDKKQIEVPGVEYIYDVATGVRPGDKMVELKSGKTVAYDALVVGSGFKLPLLSRPLGCTYEERKAEVEAWADAMSKAKTIVINGAGATGLEMAADAKLAFPSARVVVLTRSGKLMNDAYPDAMKDKFKAVLEKQGIEIIKGNGGTQPSKDKGVTPDGLEYDVFIPAFGQGVLTDFLPKDLVTDKGMVETNDKLQSVKAPEIFAVGVNTSGQGFNVSLLIKQAQDVAANAVALVQGKTLTPHKPESTINWGDRPLNVKVGHGKGGYIFWDVEQFPPPMKVMTCNGTCGFPCCPLPCCWPCGLAGLMPDCYVCGTCCGPCEGENVMLAFVKFMGPGGVKAFSDHANLPMGKNPPAGGAPPAQAMAR